MLGNITTQFVTHLRYLRCKLSMLYLLRRLLLLRSRDLLRFFFLLLSRDRDRLLLFFLIREGSQDPGRETMPMVLQFTVLLKRSQIALTDLYLESGVGYLRHHPFDCFVAAAVVEGASSEGVLG